MITARGSPCYIPQGKTTLLLLPSFPEPGLLTQQRLKGQGLLRRPLPAVQLQQFDAQALGTHLVQEDWALLSCLRLSQALLHLPTTWVGGPKGSKWYRL